MEAKTKLPNGCFMVTEEELADVVGGLCETRKQKDIAKIAGIAEARVSEAKKGKNPDAAKTIINALSKGEISMALYALPPDTSKEYEESFPPSIYDLKSLFLSYVQIWALWEEGRKAHLYELESGKFHWSRSAGYKPAESHRKIATIGRRPGLGISKDDVERPIDDLAELYFEQNREKMIKLLKAARRQPFTR